MVGWDGGRWVAGGGWNSVSGRGGYVMRSRGKTEFCEAERGDGLGFDCIDWERKRSAWEAIWRGIDAGIEGGGGKFV